jgi:AbrB family looped-hinge helix DNA binding protein
METTRLSTKGQITLPKSVRDARAWRAGTEFSVEETTDGVLLRPLNRFPESRLAEVAGYLKWRGKPQTVDQMNRAIAKEVRRRHARGRY